MKKLTRKLAKGALPIERDIVGFAEELGLIGDEGIVGRVEDFYESLGPELEERTAAALEKAGMGRGSRHSTAAARAIGDVQRQFYSDYLQDLIEAEIGEKRLLEGVAMADVAYPLQIGTLLSQLSASQKPLKVGAVSKAETTTEQPGLCGFIFTATYGNPHFVVRTYRDAKTTVRNRRGYYWFCDRVVPLMEKVKLFKAFMKAVMTAPMTCYGKYYYGLNRVGVVFAPLTAAWLLLFDLLGRRPPYRRRGTQEVV